MRPVRNPPSIHNMKVQLLLSCMTRVRCVQGRSLYNHVACLAGMGLEAVKPTKTLPMAWHARTARTTDVLYSVACVTGMGVEAVALNSAQWLPAPAMTTAWDQDHSDESFCMADFTRPSNGSGSSDYTPNYGLIIGAPLVPLMIGVLALVYLHFRWKAQAKAAKQEPQPQAVTRPTPLARLRSFGWRAAPGTEGQGAIPREAPRWTYAGPPSSARAPSEAPSDAEAPASCAQKGEAAPPAEDPKRHAWWRGQGRG